MLHVITTLDDVGAKEYKTLVASVRAHGDGIPLRVAALYGTLETQTHNELVAITDDIQCFGDFRTFAEFQEKYGARIYHPLGKLAKLFLARKYAAAHASSGDVIAFFDPDVYVQRPLEEFVALVKKGKVLFGHEMQLTHHAHRYNGRLSKALYFDTHGTWENTYFTELNTGINLSHTESFLRLIGAFEEFVHNCGYFRVIDKIPDTRKWHDQDFFRYFYRRTQNSDIQAFDIERVFTATFGAARCLYFDLDRQVYKTVWDAVPYVIHFAGRGMARIPRLTPAENFGSDAVPIPLLGQPFRGGSSQSSALAASTAKEQSVTVGEGCHAFPSARHAIYLRAGTEHLVERWMRRVPDDSRILLLTDPAAASDAERLCARFPQMQGEPLLLNTEGFSEPPTTLAARLEQEGCDAAMIPLPIPQAELEFVPGNHAPQMGPHYSIYRALWRSGFRRFAQTSYAGTKYLDLPLFLDGLVNIHTGRRCFVVGNGPSLNQLDMSLLKHEITFGSNRCYLGYKKWGYAFTYWGCMDRLQVEAYGPEYEVNIPTETLKFFPFEYVTLLDFANPCPVNFNYAPLSPNTFSGSPDVIHLGYTVTHMMLQIAVIMGCNPIYLIGCDHHYNLAKDRRKERTVGMKSARVWVAEDSIAPTHFTDEYAKGERKIFITPKPEKMNVAFREAKAWCDAHGVQVFNATPRSGLTTFPMVKYKTLFK